MRTLKCPNELRCRLLKKFIEATISFEVKMSEAIVVLADVLSVHLFKFRSELILKMEQKSLCHLAGFSVGHQHLNHFFWFCLIKTYSYYLL